MWRQILTTLLFHVSLRRKTYVDVQCWILIFVKIFTEKYFTLQKRVENIKWLLLEIEKPLGKKKKKTKKFPIEIRCILIERFRDAKDKL